MSDFQWTKTDRILYGVFVAGWVLLAISQFIRACRSRPKTEVVFIVPKGNDNGEKAKVESLSTPESQ